MPSVPPPHTLPTEPAPEPAPEPQADRPDWPLWTAPAAIVLGFGLGLVGSVFVAAVGHAGGSSLAHPTPAVRLVSDVVFDLAFVAAAIYFAGLRGRPRPTDFGFMRVSLRRGITGFLLAAVSYYVITAVYASLIKLHGKDKLPSELGVSKSTAALVGAAVFVCVVAPIAEEFFFRGFLFGVLRRWRIVVAGRDLGTWLAAIVVGLLFGLAHTGSASPQYLIPLGFLGFVLCVLRWRTGSLYPCMALHAMNNALALGINQLHWNAAEILALIVASFAVIGAITLPLSGEPSRPRVPRMI
jgi:membrane protease YdiL (CAAX protease family)